MANWSDHEPSYTMASGYSLVQSIDDLEDGDNADYRRMCALAYALVGAVLGLAAMAWLYVKAVTR